MSLLDQLNVLQLNVDFRPGLAFFSWTIQAAILFLKSPFQEKATW